MGARVDVGPNAGGVGAAEGPVAEGAGVGVEGNAEGAKVDVGRNAGGVEAGAGRNAEGVRVGVEGNAGEVRVGGGQNAGGARADVERQEGAEAVQERVNLNLHKCFCVLSCPYHHILLHINNT
uniref:Uncharacterized protein n=1 Tax=Lygus hesperus TaxID=30085 RepID=A0A0K8T608_LYGHE